MQFVNANELAKYIIDGLKKRVLENSKPVYLGEDSSIVVLPEKVYSDLCKENEDMYDYIVAHERDKSSDGYVSDEEIFDMLGVNIYEIEDSEVEFE